MKGLRILFVEEMIVLSGIMIVVSVIEEKKTAMPQTLALSAAT